MAAASGTHVEFDVSELPTDATWSRERSEFPPSYQIRLVYHVAAFGLFAYAPSLYVVLLKGLTIVFFRCPRTLTRSECSRESRMKPPPNKKNLRYVPFAISWFEGTENDVDCAMADRNMRSKKWIVNAPTTERTKGKRELWRALNGQNPCAANIWVTLACGRCNAKKKSKRRFTIPVL